MTDNAQPTEGGPEKPAAAPKTKTTRRRKTKKKAKPLQRRSLAIKVGRESVYDPTKHPERVKRMALQGQTQAEMAENLGIAEATLDRWKAKYPAFRGAIQEGGAKANERVAEALYNRALGMRVRTEKATAKGAVVEVEEYLPPDINAQRLWLFNRDPSRWRDRKHVEVSGGIEHVIAALPAEEKAERLMKLLESASKLIEGEAVEVGASDDAATDEANEA